MVKDFDDFLGLWDVILLQEVRVPEASGEIRIRKVNQHTLITTRARAGRGLGILIHSKFQAILASSASGGRWLLQRLCFGNTHVNLMCVHLPPKTFRNRYETEKAWRRDATEILDQSAALAGITIVGGDFKAELLQCGDPSCLRGIFLRGKLNG